MNKKRPILFIMLLLALLAGNFAMGASYELEEFISAAPTQEQQSKTPFYQEANALLSSPGLVFSHVHVPEAGGFSVFFIPFPTDRIYPSLIRFSVFLNAHFSLLHRYIILFPFHSFW